MTEVGVGFVQLLPSMRGFASAVSSQLGSEMDSVSGKIGKQAGSSFASGFGTSAQQLGRATSGLGDRMAIGLTVPLIAAGNQVTNYARDTNENLSKVRTVFGGAAGSIEDFSKGAAQSFGLSNRAALEATGTFGNMFDQIGFGADQNAAMSTAMVGLAADFASFNNLNTEDVIAAQAAAFRGEFDALQRVVPTINAAAVEQKAMAMTGKENAKELTQQEKALAVYEFMLENAGAATGDFARTSEDLANAERIAAAEAENAAAQFGNNLMPIKLQLVEVVGQLLDKFNSLSPAQQEMITKAGLLTAVLGPVLSIFGRIITGIGGLVKGVGFLGKGLVNVVRFGGKAAVGLGKMSVQFGKLALSAGRAALAVGRAGLQMAVSAAKATARVVAQIALQIGRWVVLGVQALIHAAKVALAWLISLGPIALVVAAVIAAVALIIANWDKVSKFIAQASQWVWDKVTTIFSALADFFWNWITTVVGFYLGLPGMIVGAIVAIFDLFVEWSTKAKDWVIARILDIIAFHLSMPGRLAGGIIAIYDLFVEWLSKARDWAGRAIDQVVGFFGSLPGRIVGFIFEIFSLHVKVFGLILRMAGINIDDLIGFFRAIPGRVRSAISRIVSIIKSPFERAFRAIKRLWNSTVGGFGFTVPSWIPKVGGRGFRIPRMHSGGIFEAMSGNEGLALLQSGEMVLTEAQQRGLGGSGASGPAQIQIVFSGRNNDLLMRWLKQQVRIRGGNVQAAFS